MKELKFHSLEEALDRHFGVIGMPERDEHERLVAESVEAYKLGEVIKNERKRQNMTQEQLGERIGMKKAQISRMEKGNGLSLPSLSRVFQALGVASATLDLGTMGRIELW